jgi:hypothetical protein
MSMACVFTSKDFATVVQFNWFRKEVLSTYRYLGSLALVFFQFFFQFFFQIKHDLAKK